MGAHRAKVGGRENVRSKDLSQEETYGLRGSERGLGTREQKARKNVVRLRQG